MRTYFIHFNCFIVIPSQPLLDLAGKLSILLSIHSSLISCNWNRISEFPIVTSSSNLYLVCKILTYVCKKNELLK